MTFTRLMESIDTVLTAAPSVLLLCLSIVIFIRRLRWRRKRLRGENIGLRPGFGHLGNALQVLQQMPRPSVEYVLEEKLKEDAEDEDSGEPDDVEKTLNRQLRQIRRGERVDRLCVPLQRRGRSR